MPVELIACPKCRGQGSEYAPNKWRCLKCGHRFIYTAPLATAAVAAPAEQIIYAQAAPAAQEVIVKHVWVNAPPEPEKKKRRKTKLGRLSLVAWAIAFGCAAWGRSDPSNQIAPVVCSSAGLVAIVCTALWILRGFFGLIMGKPKD